MTHVTRGYKNLREDHAVQLSDHRAITFLSQVDPNTEMLPGLAARGQRDTPSRPDQDRDVRLVPSPALTAGVAVPKAANGA